MPKLGVNIDHVATLRQARRGFDPDPAMAAKICEKAGAHSIVCHLREDRRHIQQKDVRTLRNIVTTRLNLEMSLHPGIIDIAVDVRPDEATIVPERRQELTTEGGLDVCRHYRRIQKAISRLQKRKIIVSLFIDPQKEQIQRSRDAGAGIIELHTGRYAEAQSPLQKRKELQKLRVMTQYARQLGLIVNAGHGLNYHNTAPVAAIKGITELNIGHSIICRAVFVGLPQAVQEMCRMRQRKQMIQGIGIDIIEVNRIEKAIERWGNHFLTHLFCDEEIAYSQKQKFPAQHYAARFAAKEAVLKAIGDNSHLGWKDIKIINEHNGIPMCQLNDPKFKGKILVSLSHTQNYAVATAIIAG